MADGQNVKSVIIEIVNIFSDRSPVKNLLINRRNSSKEYDENKLIIVSDEVIKSLPLHHCDFATTCAKCVQLQDPYCAWDEPSKKCVGNSNG